MFFIPRKSVFSPHFNQYTEDSTRKKVLLTHQLSLLAFSAALVFSGHGFLFGISVLGYLNLALSLLYIAAYGLNRFGYLNAARSFLVFSACISVFIVSSTQGRHSGNNLLYLPIICGIFVLYDLRERVRRWLHVCIPVMCLLLLEYTHYSLLATPLISPQSSPFFINFSICVVTFWLCVNSLLKTNNQTEAVLRESEINLTALIENTSDAIWSLDREGRILTLNSTFKRSFQQYTGVELRKGSRILDFVLEGEKQTWSEIHQRASAGERFSKKLRYIVEGNTIDVEVWVNPILGRDGSVTGMSFISKDITKRIKAEEKLRFHASILSNVHDAIVGMNNEYQITYWNEGAEQQYGLTAEEVISKNIQEVYRPIWLEPAEEAAANQDLVWKGRCRSEMLHELPGGKRLCVDVTTQVWYDESDQAIGYIAIIRDISQRRQAQEESRHKSSILRMLLNNMPVMFYRLTSDGTILESLGNGLKTLGLEENQLIGQNFYELYPSFTPTVVAQASQAGTIHECKGETNGQVWYFDKYFFSDPKGGYICFARETTDKRRDEETIRANNAKLTTILESTQSSIFALDGYYRYIAFNSRHEATMNRLYGLEIEQGMSLLDLKTEVLEQEFDVLTQYAQRAMTGEQLSLVQEYGHPLIYRAFFETSFTPIRNEANLITGVAVFSKDISEQKRSEDELRRINFELDSFVYRSSHDMRAPLRSLLGLTNLVRMEENQPQRERYLSLIDKSVNKLDTFINDMTNFSRNSRQVLNIQPVDFDDIIRDCAENLRYMDNADRVTLRTNLQLEAPFYSDSLRISTVLQNLLSNSVKYQRLHIDDAYVQIDIHCNAERALIKYTDNGKGIDSNYLPRIFDMFFRASIDSYGSGLGLYIVKQVVEKLQGQIRAESRLGEGTHFTVQLPNLKPTAETDRMLREGQA
jgi:PAS domain S-box-containing protein